MTDKQQAILDTFFGLERTIRPASKRLADIYKRIYVDTFNAFHDENVLLGRSEARPTLKMKPLSENYARAKFIAEEAMENAGKETVTLN